MKKIFIGITVVMLVLSVFLFGGQHSYHMMAEDDSTEPEKVQEFYEPSYKDYLIENGFEGELSRSSVEVNITQFRKLGNMQASNVDGAITTSDSGVIEWEFVVEDAGFYNIQIEYLPMKGTNSSIKRRMYINGEMLFRGMEQIVLNRIWLNSKDGGIISKNGNEIRPVAVESFEWRTVFIGDSLRRSLDPYAVYFTSGIHTIALESIREPVKIGRITLLAAPEIKTYEEAISSLGERYSKYGGDIIVYQAERIDGNTVGIKKSSPTISLATDFSSSNSVPFHPYRIVLNVIGGNNWRLPGDFIEWVIEVPESGLYQLSFRARQNINRGVKSYRKLRINGEIPFEEAKKIGFEFSGGFRNHVVGNEKEAYLVRLNEGKNIISLEVVLGEFGPLLTEVEQNLFKLNDLFRRTVKLTGLVPDRFVDYEIDTKIPDFVPILEEVSGSLNGVANQLVMITKERGEKTAIIERMALQAKELSENPESVVNELAVFQGNIAALAIWITHISEMPLEIDSFMLSAINENIPEAEPNFFVRIYYELVRFLSTFIVNHAELATESEIGGNAVTVWISSGRDQAQIIRTMIDDSFTPYTGIPINLKLIPLDVIIPATLAGEGPDVVLNVSATTVMNLAVRNALKDLSEFGQFEQIAKRFQPSALKPVTFQDGIYGLPEQQWFNMLFYRKDILEALEIEPPRTWEDIKKMIPVLHKHNYEFFMPAGPSVFLSMLYQLGGDLYKGEGSDYGIASGLTSEEAMIAFESFSEFFTSYGLPVAADFPNRFRTGEMPIGIAPYTTYNLLEVFAPEIRGLWAISMFPGTDDSYGNINKTVISDTMQCMMLYSARNKDNAWEFMIWWLDEYTQLRYAHTLEAVMGPSARYATANLNLIRQLPWPTLHAEYLIKQFEKTVGIPEVPGGYMSARMIDYAFRAVVTDGRNPRQSLYLNIKAIDEELTRKRIEFILSHIELIEGCQSVRNCSRAWELHKEKYLLIAPFALIFVVFTVAPVVVSMIFSFTSFNMLEMPRFIGLKNFIDLIVFDEIFLIAVRNTLLFAVITGPISYVMSFAFAWLINELPPKIRALLTLVFYAPSISGNAYLMWSLVFSSDLYGFANAWLMRTGLISQPILWFNESEFVLPILIMVQLWLSLGISFLAFIAGFQNIDKTLYEAGMVDGIKNRWQEVWLITLPAMKPQLMFGAVMQITGSMSVAGISMELAGFPSVEYAGHTILTHLHDHGHIRYEMGYASAIAIILFFAMLFSNIIVQKLLRKVGS